MVCAPVDGTSSGSRKQVYDLAVASAASDDHNIVRLKVICHGVHEATVDFLQFSGCIPDFFEEVVPVKLDDGWSFFVHFD